MRGLRNLSNSADIMHLGNLMLRPTDLPFVTRIWGKHTIRRFEDNFHHQSKYIGYKFMNLNFSWTYFEIFYLWISSRISNSIEIYIKLKKKNLSNRALAAIFLTFLFCLLFIRHHDCELSFSSSLNLKLRCFIWCFPGEQLPITPHPKRQIRVLHAQRKSRTSVWLQSTSELILGICSRTNGN